MVQILPICVISWFYKGGGKENSSGRSHQIVLTADTKEHGDHGCHAERHSGMTPADSNHFCPDVYFCLKRWGSLPKVHISLFGTNSKSQAEKWRTILDLSFTHADWWQM